MLKINVNGQNFEFDYISGIPTLNGQPVQADAVKIGTNKYHLLIENQSYTLELLEKSDNGKSLELLVNGVKQVVNIQDKYDTLLEKLGIGKMMAAKGGLVKAPMPGLVLKVLVNVGDAVKKGDTLFLLEAMKMENSIKSEMDGVIKQIKVDLKQAVEKNTVLAELE